jgi:hypothetical protein
MRGTIATLVAPAAAGALFMAPSASAAVSITAAAGTTVSPAPPLRCHATVSNSRPKDHSITYVNVTTARGARVTAVAHYRTGSQRRTATANTKGSARIAYPVGSATPGHRVPVTVTVTSGRSHSSCSTSFMPQR